VTECLPKRWSQSRPMVLCIASEESPGGHRQPNDHTRWLDGTATVWVAISSIELMPKRRTALRPLDDGGTINLHLQYTLQCIRRTIGSQVSRDDCGYISDCRERPAGLAGDVLRRSVAAWPAYVRRRDIRRMHDALCLVGLSLIAAYM